MPPQRGMHMQEDERELVIEAEFEELELPSSRACVYPADEISVASPRGKEWRLVVAYFHGEF